MTDARDLATRLFAVIDGHRWDDYETVVHPDVQMISPFGTLAGAAEWVAFSQGFANAIPNGRHTITEAVQDGDRAAVRGDWNGTHTGPMSTPQGEVPPTGVAVSLPFCAMFEIRDGRVARADVYLDQLSMLAQLGLVPVPA